MSLVRATRRPSEGRVAFWYVLPALVGLSLLSFLPIAYTIWIAFTNYDVYHLLNYHFVGFANFVALFAGPWASTFLPVLLWTFLFAILTSLLNYIGGFILALLLNNRKLGWSGGLYRSLLIIPWALPSTVTILVWSGILNHTFGALDLILHHLGLPKIPWLTSVPQAYIAILLVNFWLGFPFFMVSLLGALQSISTDLYEAAQLDGATTLQQHRYITLPLLLQFSFPLLLGTFGYNLNNFGVIYLLTGGGPPRLTSQFAGHTDVLASFIYNLTKNYYRYDLASATGVILFLIVGTFTLIQMRLFGVFSNPRRG
jgi:arabinogalactan oligomer/maltooligosaccharide transport system permease protein